MNEELKKQIKRKRLRKYSLVIIAVAAVVALLVGFKIESKDAKIPDAEGNINVIADNNTVSEEVGDKGGEQGEDASDVEKEEKPTANQTSTESKDESSGNVKTESKPKTPKENKVDNSKDVTASNGGNEELKPDEAQPVTVTIEISCKALSDDMSKLENEALVDYIPEDGIILAATEYKGTTENTVFDVLNAVCRNNDIQLDFQYTPVYESYYVEGINYLYEFDGGPLSGWMYHVNGWYPNYGCSSYYLSDGDKIEWLYTCNLGSDVGGNLS